jgi:type IX secretion system PorP/SprF family membrane protein
MRNLRAIVLVIIAMTFASAAFSQDAHHTQYFNLPAYYNPAAAGHNVEHIRLTGLYRKQWPSLATPFLTQSILFDKQVSRVGFGALINNNTAGSAGIKRMQLGGMISYRLKFKQHQIATGVSVGFIQKSFDPSAMTFDDQYMDDAGYDAANPTAEQFAFTKVIRPDFSAGFLWTHGDLFNTRWVPYAGASLMHINKPSEVLIEESNVNPMKTVLQAGTKFSVNEKIEIDPSVLMSMQQFSTELMFGSRAAYKFDTRTKAEGGIYIRNNESAMLYAGYQWNSMMVGISYDITTSGAVSGPGAFEISLTYIPKAKAKKDKKAAAADSTALNKEVAKKEPEKPSAEEKKEALADSTSISKEAAIAPAEVKSDVIPSEEKKENPIVTPEVGKEEVASSSENKDGAKPEISKEKTDTASPEIKQTQKELPKATSVTAPTTNIKPISSLPLTPKVTSVSIADIDTDTDGDGIDDLPDECPFLKGNAANNGCPDSDNDGINDLVDRCPMEKGTIERNGCPGETTIAKNAEGFIRFDVNSAEIKGFDIIDILEPVADSLYFDKNLKLVITGHTDDEGDEEYNMYLSEDRAEAVKQYFVDHGVPSEKIETLGYGERMPHADNSTEDGKKRNRRAEIYIVRK